MWSVVFNLRNSLELEKRLKEKIDVRQRQEALDQQQEGLV